MYYAMFSQIRKQLRQVDRLFDIAEAHAKEKSFDVNVLVSARLAPDQFPLSRQLQVACDTAKLGASRLTGKDAPPHADTEQTIAELRARVHSVLAYLDGFTPADFALARAGRAGDQLLPRLITRFGVTWKAHLQCPSMIL